MDFALISAAALLALAGLPHCAAMCGAACTAAIGGAGAGRSVPWLFHAARVAAYAAAGAAAAASVNVLSAIGQAAPALRPLWTLVHVGALALGVWLLWQGRQPGWMARIGTSASRTAAPAGWQRLRGPVRGAAAGALWVAWPCGLLQSALVVAALANTAVAGAAVMGSFAVLSAAGLGAGPWLWRRLGGGAASAASTALAVRAAGLMLALASAWALGHGLWTRVIAWCLG